MIKLPVNLQNFYNINIGENCLNQIGSLSKNVTKAKKVAIITDSNVEKLYLNVVKNSFLKENFQITEIVFEAGEKNKTPQTYFDCIEKIADAKFTRQDLVVALGGGVVGDIAGFVASTYMRGIDFIQVPTTLLAGIDSSIGGKTGVDLPQGKNLLGAFYQPKLVLFDITTLNTLPELEWKNGLGEGLKYAILAGGETYEILENGLNKDNLLRFIELCAKYKVDVVVNDEKEKGNRVLLNLGHTVGHAIEALSNFKVSHGVGVAKGIFKIAYASKNNGTLSDIEFNKIVNLLEKYNFNIICNFTDDDIISKIIMDKKLCSNNQIKFIDIEKIGDCKAKTITLDRFKEYIR